MPAATINLPAIEKYASYNVPITLSSDFCNGTPIDLTSCTADMMLRATLSGADVLEFSTANGKITIPTPTNGTLNLVLTASQTAAITAGTYLYDLLVTFPSGVVTRFIQGTVTVVDGVTHA